MSPLNVYDGAPTEPAICAICAEAFSQTILPAADPTSTAKVDVTVHDQALLVHLTINNRSAASVVIPLSSLGKNNFSLDSADRDHDLALLMHLALTQ